MRPPAQQRRAAPNFVASAVRRHLQQEGGWDSRFDAWLSRLRELGAARHRGFLETRR